MVNKHMSLLLPVILPSSPPKRLTYLVHFFPEGPDWPNLTPSTVPSRIPQSTVRVCLYEKIPSRDVGCDEEALPGTSGASASGERSVVVERRVVDGDVERDVSRLARKAEGVGRELFAGFGGVRGPFAGERVY